MRKGMTLEFKVTQQEITRLDSQKVYEGTKGYLYAHFVFSDDWEGYLKTVKFSNLLDNSYIGVTLASDNTCMVPYTLILYPGVTFCIEGTSHGDIITTNEFIFDVDESNSTVPEVPADNYLEITNNDFTIKDDKIVFSNHIANEIMSMNRTLKVDASIINKDFNQGEYIVLFNPMSIINYRDAQEYTIYEYSATNCFLFSYRTTYVLFWWYKTTNELWVDASNPTFEEDHITGFDTNWSDEIRLTSDSDLCTSIINPLKINELSTISFDDHPKLKFNHNGKDELESVEFMQNGYSSDFIYTVPKGSKHYVVNELPTTDIDIDTTGNYYVMTESVDGRSFLSTDISNLSTTEFPVRMGDESRSNAVVNATDYTMLSSAYVSVGEYRGSLAIRFNIPCAVTVTLNPRPSSSSGSGRFGFMNLYKNNYNNHLLLTNAGEVGTVSQNFAKDEILCIDCSGYTDQFYYKLEIQPHTIDGKIPLSTKVDEYINFENLWFKNGGGSYTGGDGINISNENVISVDNTIAKKSEIPTDYVTLDTEQTITGLKTIGQTSGTISEVGFSGFTFKLSNKAINHPEADIKIRNASYDGNQYPTIYSTKGLYVNLAKIKLGEDGSNTYGITMPDSTTWETDKVLATTDDIHNPTITFTQGGTTKGSISLNQASDQTIALDAGGSGGGSSVIANPTLSGDEATLDGLEVDGTKYKVGGGLMEIVTLNYVLDGQLHSITQEQATKLQNGAILTDESGNVYSLTAMQNNGSTLAYQGIVFNDSFAQIIEVDGIVINIDRLLYQCMKLGQMQ